MKNVTSENFKRAEAELKKQAEELAQKPTCPDCGTEIWDVAGGGMTGAKLNKCWNCGTAFDSPEIEADLKDFGLTDNGTYLNVSHAALHDATIGIVSKNEYEKGDKEALLRSVLENKCAEFVNTHTLKIVGKFVEPKIEKKAEDDEVGLIMAYEDGQLDDIGTLKLFSLLIKNGHAWSLQGHYGRTAKALIDAGYIDNQGNILKDVGVESSQKYAFRDATIEPAKEITSDLPLLRSADSFRQATETVEFRASEKLNRFVASATNGLVEHLRSLRYDMPKVSEVDASSLTENGESFNGYITASVSLENSTGPKYLNLPITISASKVVYPNEKETADFVSKGIDLQSKLEEKLALETLTEMARVDAQSAWESENISNIISEKSEEIVKEASDYTDGISSTGPGAHIKLQKHLLPGELADWEVGDTVVADGKKWKLVSKGDGIDSNDKNAGSASLWDFVECLPEEGDDKAKADLPR